MNFYSAVFLMCSYLDGEKPVCMTETSVAAFDSKLQCHIWLVEHEKENGRLWAEMEKYVVSTTCIDWAWKVNKRYLRDLQS